MMRYEKFIVRNFKGIKEAVVDLRSMTGANVFALVGLNESGKTTVLEAIHSFAPDWLSRNITKAGSGDAKEKAQSRVPRHKLAGFSGDVSVQAIISTDAVEEAEFRQFALAEYDLLIEKGQFPEKISVTKIHRFERGDFVGDFIEVDFTLKVKRKGSKKFVAAGPETSKILWGVIFEFVPSIAYYPTFIFDFPERIYLKPRPGSYDAFYRSVFEDVLAYDGHGYTIEDIQRRIRSAEHQVPWVEFLPTWMAGDSRTKVQQIIDRASKSMTEVVLGKWNKIFGEDASGKEIVVEYGLDEGRVFDKGSKTYLATQEHDIYVRFEIKDGSRRFKVNDRSLGFRWFFAFLLFTQFRVARSSGHPILFLFDEPAANLHAAAQQKLIESFPEIATGSNMLIYSTHSHYMIDPAWLEQTFIVTNRADTPKDSIMGNALLDDESLDIKAEKYREFVNSNPEETSYFQPIRDRLEIIPSRFDYHIPSVVLEGKSDYYILEYVRRQIEGNDLRLLPATGSGTFSSLISLSVGWGTKFLFLLDSDKAGLKERDRYAENFGARKDALCAIGDFLEGASEIEDLLDEDSLIIIQEQLGIRGKPNKKQILRFFQEGLAKRSYVTLGSSFTTQAGKLLKKLDEKLASL